MLKEGIRGSAVVELQRKLCLLGYDVEVDGVFGPITRWAVINLQAMFGYSVDGVVGPGTQLLIDKQVAHGFHIRRPDAQRWALTAQGLLRTKPPPRPASSAL